MNGAPRRQWQHSGGKEAASTEPCPWEQELGAHVSHPSASAVPPKRVESPRGCLQTWGKVQACAIGPVGRSGWAAVRVTSVPAGARVRMLCRQVP